MPRALRPHLPGVPFHLTARLQGRAPLFLGIESRVTELMRDAAAAAGGDLLAHVVMPNHLHAVFVQGTPPLAAFMQPLLRRLAILIHSRNRSEGHVFQRRFFSVPCIDPEYLRNSILYVHLNPVRAGFCADPGHYQWSSHADYLKVASWNPHGAPSGLRLFAGDRGASARAVQESYRTMLEWRVRTDALARNPRDRALPDPPQRPPTTAGDEYWVDRFGWTCAGGAEHKAARRPALDLRDLALRLLRGCEPPLQLDVLCSGSRTRTLVAVRRQFIIWAKERGHRNRAIARFLRVSDVTVSRA